MTEQTFIQDARRYLAMLHKRRGLLASCVVTSMIVAVVYNYTSRPLYQATTKILIERDTPNILPTKEILDLAPSAADYYQTQYQLLQGRSLAERVVERIGFQRSQEVKTGPLMSPFERVRLKLFGKPPAKTTDSDGILLSPAVAAFRSRLTIDPIRGTRLVNIKFSAYDPALAALAANTLAELYIEQSLEYHYTTSKEATGWLSERLKEQQAKVEAAERALQSYREREGLVNIEERQTLMEQKLSALNGAALTARTERIAKETLYRRMQDLSTGELETFPMVMENPLIQGLKAQLAELQTERARLSETLGEKHPDMIRVRSQIKATNEKIRTEIHNIVRSAQSDYQTARQQEASLQASLEAVKREALEINRKAIEFGVLKREVESHQELFKDLLNRTKETGLESELPKTNIRINERAESGALISPQYTKNYGIALMIGLGLGIGLILLFEHMDNTIKTPEDLKHHLADLPFLGVVPNAPIRAPGTEPNPMIASKPHSAIAEAYRVLRTNLLFSSAETTGKAVLVTSAGPGEGKTTTAANLAASLAQTGASVLIVEADLRRPKLGQVFSTTRAPGLSDLIVGRSEAPQSIRLTAHKGLMLLPCGYVPPNPAELLGSGRMKEIVRALRSHYDWVIFDTPPVLAMADTPVLCPLVDGIILVVAAESSTRPAVTRAVDQIKNTAGKIIGVILNKVDLQRNAYYYGQYYGEYYRKYYAEEPKRPVKSGRRAAPPPPRGI
jgi:succinoglycan biosynthesis transport protein ExoP